MADDMYPMAGNPMDSQSAPPSDQNRDAEEEQGGGESALIPKSILDGMDIKVGSSITLKVVHEYEDEIEVQAVKGGEKSEDGGGMRDGDGSEMQAAMGRMGSMGDTGEG
jgi:hypothetical protein